MTQSKGIQWSAPVLIRQVGKELAVTLPLQVLSTLKAGAGDVLNFTQLPDGCIEVWLVRKSHYTSLDALAGQSADKPARSAPNRSAKGAARPRAGTGKGKAKQ